MQKKGFSLNMSVFSDMEETAKKINSFKDDLQSGLDSIEAGKKMVQSVYTKTFPEKNKLDVLINKAKALANELGVELKSNPIVLGAVDLFDVIDESNIKYKK